jgi:hypothetical protein
MSRRSHLIRNATIAALVGSTAGAIAGLWSVRDRADSVAVSTTATGGNVAASPASPPTGAATGQSGQDPAAREGLSNSIAVATRGVVPSTTPPASVRPGSTQNDSQKVVQRARALAEVPDVYGLVTLREGISRRAADRGELESPATQELIRELDRYLADARRLRLKLDGEALRRDQTVKPPRTGR